MAAYQKALGKKITTEVAAASDYDKYGGVWFYAEPYHQVQSAYRFVTAVMRVARVHFMPGRVLPTHARRPPRLEHAIFPIRLMATW